MEKQNERNERKQSIRKCIQSFAHASQCGDATCGQTSCPKYKRVVEHTKICRGKATGTCPICKQLIALCCYHSKHCKDSKCVIPFCSNIKQKVKLKQQQLMQSGGHKSEKILRMKYLNLKKSPKSKFATGGSPPIPYIPVGPVDGSMMDLMGLACHFDKHADESSIEVRKESETVDNESHAPTGHGETPAQDNAVAGPSTSSPTPLTSCERNDISVKIQEQCFLEEHKLKLQHAQEAHELQLQQAKEKHAIKMQYMAEAHQAHLNLMAEELQKKI